MLLKKNYEVSSCDLRDADCYYIPPVTTDFGKNRFRYRGTVLFNKLLPAGFNLARARPAVPLGLWSITSLLRGNLYVPRLCKFIKWFADNDAPTAIKLVLSCLWYRNASVSTNMFSDCRNLIALKPINLRWIVATKCASSETVQSR